MSPTKALFPLAGAIAYLALFASAAHAQTFVFTDFSSPSGLTLNGSATTTAGAVASDGTVLRLTPANYYQAGSAFSTTLVPLNDASSFSTAFTFRITSSGGIGDADGAGADGIAFVVQPLANNVGGVGGGIGYAGITSSLAVEFDTYNNGGIDDNDGNHVGIDENGDLNSVLLTPVSTRFNNGALWYAWIDYNGATTDLQVRLSQTSTRPTDPLLESNSIDLSSILGQNSAYVGFTSGTGAGYGNHDIVSWQFNNTYKPIDNVGGVPDGGSTTLLLGIGLLSLVAARWRRQSC